jgi:uncharacterized protein
MNASPGDGRRLGDAWVRWDGRIPPAVQDSSAARNTVLLLGCIGLAVCAGLCFFAVYMIRPRLAQWHPAAPVVVEAVLAAIWFLLLAGIALIAVSVRSRGRPGVARLLSRISVRWVLPLALKTGGFLGQSADRITHSFIRLHNGLSFGAGERFAAGRILILLPRCLTPELRESAMGIAGEFGIPAFVVSGGEMARRIVIDKDPMVVIAAACERDLLGGIRDLCRRRIVLGIPNRRPEGPCKDTWIDAAELREAIQRFWEGGAAAVSEPGRGSL